MVIIAIILGLLSLYKTFKHEKDFHGYNESYDELCRRVHKVRKHLRNEE